MVTANLLIDAVVLTLAVTFVVTVEQIVNEKVEEFIQRLKIQVIEFVVITAIELEKLYGKMADKFREFKNQLLAEVKGFFNRIGDSLKKWLNSGTRGIAHSEIKVNIANLRELAARLSRVQSKINSVDRSYMLTGLVDIEDKLPLMLIQNKIGFDYDLMGCIHYLNQAADDLERCERQILSAAYAF